MHVVVHVDGGSRGNPGPAAAAAVISTPDGEVLDEATLTLGRATRIGTMDVIARSCAKAAPEEQPEVRIYVDVVDHPPPREGQEAQTVPLFHGWLFASSPGLNAVEHPVYDLWAVDCKE